MMPRPILYVAAAILLGMLGSAAYLAFQQYRQRQAIERPAAAHAATVATETARQVGADSIRNRLAGRIEEAHAHTDTTTNAYEVLRRHLPAVPVLPVSPPRYRSTH